MSRQRAGSIAIVVGGLVFLVAQTFLAYFEVGRFAVTFWDIQTRVPVILTVIAVAAIALAAASLITEAMLPPILAAACSFYLLGRVLPIGYDKYTDVGIGHWLTSGATIAMSIGSILALTERAGFASHFAGPSE